MKFVCERCHTKYSIADEKVRGKVLKVRCKGCENVITVRETGASVDDPPGAADAARGGGAAVAGALPATAARIGGLRDEASPPRTTAILGSGPHGGGRPSGRPTPLPLPSIALAESGAFHPPPPGASPAAAPLPAPARRPTPAPMASLHPSSVPPPVIVDDGIEWYLAVDGNRTGPFGRTALVEKIVSLAKQADVHIWNADFDGWKPPKDVPEVRADLARRRRQLNPVPPPPPTPVPVPRHPSPAMPLAAAPAEGAAVAGTPAPVVSPAVDPARPMPATGKADEPKRNGVTGSHAVAPAAVGDDLGVLTPAPVTLSAASSTPGSAPLAALPQQPTAEKTSVVAKAAAEAPRGRPTKLLVGAALGLVVVVCGVVAASMLRKQPPSVSDLGAAARSAADEAAAAASKLAADEQAKAAALVAEKEKAEKEKLAAAPPAKEKLADKPSERPEPVAAADPDTSDSGTKKHGPGKKPARKGPPPTSPPPLAAGATTPPASARMTAEQLAEANRFGDNSRDVRIPTTSSGASRSGPAQADISRVVTANKQGIHTCYQRALLRDNTLTHGKITVLLSINVSGKVKKVGLDAPAPFRALEPCIRDVTSRWAFPPSSEEYSTEFPVVLQGNQ